MTRPFPTDKAARDTQALLNAAEKVAQGTGRLRAAEIGLLRGGVEAAIRKLQWLAENEGELRAFIASRRGGAR
jgi:hypothetical protein